ncbi:hypothetical protein OHT52_12550 [Streptomyces sp. NBC_00247]|uniref:hypothetical protein n=1 Tax=Streptomyces sp. NBC_00247 TaxID=2975689 RepID=UPI002E2BBEED|nr:hypothetical protein [Streptomyces sp. NBC_00247]
MVRPADTVAAAEAASAPIADEADRPAALWDFPQSRWTTGIGAAEAAGAERGATAATAPPAGWTGAGTDVGAGPAGRRSGTTFAGIATLRWSTAGAGAGRSAAGAGCGIAGGNAVDPGGAAVVGNAGAGTAGAGTAGAGTAGPGNA